MRHEEPSLTTHNDSSTASFDAAVGLGALASPLWLQIVDASAQHVMLVGGAALVLVRLSRALLRLYRRLAGGRAAPDERQDT
jgi:hypothetical protein